MGNAAGVEQSLNRRAAHLLPATEYARIERLCNSGYFSSRLMNIEHLWSEWFKSLL